MFDLCKKVFTMIGGGLIAILVVLLMLGVIYGLSWIITCGIIALICTCFGWQFSWGVATGVWLILCLVKGIFNVTVNNNN